MTQFSSLCTLQGGGYSLSSPKAQSLPKNLFPQAPPLAPISSRPCNTKSRQISDRNRKTRCLGTTHLSSPAGQWHLSGECLRLKLNG